MSTPAPKFAEHMALSRHLNQPLWPLSKGDVQDWKARSNDDIRSALKSKVVATHGKSGIMDAATASVKSAGSTLRA